MAEYKHEEQWLDFENNRLVLCFRPQSSQRRTSYRVLSITPHPNVNHVYIQYTKASSVTTEDRVLEVFVEDLFKVGKAVYKDNVLADGIENLKHFRRLCGPPVAIHIATRLCEISSLLLLHAVIDTKNAKDALSSCGKRLNAWKDILSPEQYQRSSSVLFPCVTQSVAAQPSVLIERQPYMEPEGELQLRTHKQAVEVPLDVAEATPATNDDFQKAAAMVSAPDCVSIETLGEMQAAHETETQKGPAMIIEENFVNLGMQSENQPGILIPKVAGKRRSSQNSRFDGSSAYDDLLPEQVGKKRELDGASAPLAAAVTKPAKLDFSDSSYKNQYCGIMTVPVSKLVVPPLDLRVRPVTMHHVQNMKQSFLSLGHSTVRIVVEAVRVSGPMTSSEFDSKHVYVQIENASALTEALEAKDPCLVFSVISGCHSSLALREIESELAQPIYVQADVFTKLSPRQFLTIGTLMNVKSSMNQHSSFFDRLMCFRHLFLDCVKQKEDSCDPFRRISDITSRDAASRGKKAKFNQCLRLIAETVGKPAKSLRSELTMATMSPSLFAVLSNIRSSLISRTRGLNDLQVSIFLKSYMPKQEDRTSIIWQATLAELKQAVDAREGNNICTVKLRLKVKEQKRKLLIEQKIVEISGFKSFSVLVEKHPGLPELIRDTNVCAKTFGGADLCAQDLWSVITSNTAKGIPRIDRSCTWHDLLKDSNILREVRCILCHGEPLAISSDDWRLLSERAKEVCIANCLLPDGPPLPVSGSKMMVLCGTDDLPRDEFLHSFAWDIGTVKFQTLYRTDISTVSVAPAQHAHFLVQNTAATSAISKECFKQIIGKLLTYSKAPGSIVVHVCIANNVPESAISATNDLHLKNVICSV